MSSDPKLEDKIEKTRMEGLKGGEISFIVYLAVFKNQLKAEGNAEALLDERKIVHKLVNENWKKFTQVKDNITEAGLEKLLKSIGLGAMCQQNGASKI